MSETVTTYLDLIAPEHNQQPNFTATVSLSVKPFVDGQNVLYGLPELYDLDVAVASQLDAVGLWVGLSRYVPIPLVGVYFTWGSSTLGWDYGVWKGPFDPFDGLVALPDEIYRLVLRTRIAANNWDGTVASAAAALTDLFNGTTTPGTLLFIQNNQNMTIVVGISGQIPAPVFSTLLSNGSFPFRTAGVQASYVQTSVNNTPCFGFGVENDYISGWSVGAWSEAIGESAATNLLNDGGVLTLQPGIVWPTTSGGAPGSFWSNGGVVSVVPGATLDPTFSPTFFNVITANQLQLLNGGDLAWAQPPSGSGQLWAPGGASGGDVWVA
jgi:hypothetical protein